MKKATTNGIRFYQIATSEGRLVALDASGRVYQLVTDEYGQKVWEQLTDVATHWEQSE